MNIYNQRSSYLLFPHHKRIMDASPSLINRNWSNGAHANSGPNPGHSSLPSQPVSAVTSACKLPHQQLMARLQLPSITWWTFLFTFITSLCKCLKSPTPAADRKIAIAFSNELQVNIILHWNHVPITTGLSPQHRGLRLYFSQWKLLYSSFQDFKLATLAYVVAFCSNVTNLKHP